MGLRPIEFFYFFQCGDRLYTSEFNDSRRQILTYEDGRRQILTYENGPRTERVKHKDASKIHTFSKKKLIYYGAE